MPKKYDWTDKRDICYNVYVEQGKSLRELKEYLCDALGVAQEDLPSYVFIGLATDA